jgi:hypothetical protein
MDRNATNSPNKLGYRETHDHRSHSATRATASIEAEIARIAAMNIAELRTLWGTKFKVPPPKAYGPDLLRRVLAQKIQEDAYGGLDAKTARLLNQLIAQSAKNAGKIVLPRRMKPGTVIVREWKGTPHLSVETHTLHSAGKSSGRSLASA